jgi:hypothetical protein
MRLGCRTARDQKERAVDVGLSARGSCEYCMIRALGSAPTLGSSFHVHSVSRASQVLQCNPAAVWLAPNECHESFEGHVEAVDQPHLTADPRRKEGGQGPEEGRIVTSLPSTLIAGTSNASPLLDWIFKTTGHRERLMRTGQVVQIVAREQGLVHVEAGTCARRSTALAAAQVPRLRRGTIYTRQSSCVRIISSI